MRSFALGYRYLGAAPYRHAAERAAELLWTMMRRPDGPLWHSYRSGVAKVDGKLDDYAYLLVPLMELHEVTGDEKRLRRARELADTMVRLFWDEREGGKRIAAATTGPANGPRPASSMPTKVHPIATIKC